MQALYNYQRRLEHGTKNAIVARLKCFEIRTGHKFIYFEGCEARVFPRRVVGNRICGGKSDLRDVRSLRSQYP
jgi:hypothetical protein